MPYSSIDEQVVKMSFDNSNFDSNINDSIRTLNSLDKQLGILNKNDFHSITNNFNNLAKTFTVKGQIMFGVLATLGNKIVNLGSQAFKKLTQGIRDGLGEYNQIIESTQTIYQNVKQNGNSLKDVNNALDELNDYADKTIYNFGQMTRMIGMFTSAGVGLNKSVSTIKGLANAAALVGATPERAQIAWQAVSRAMSSGRFTNVIWRSLELSNIAGKQFNTVIKEVARANKVVGKGGQNIDQMIKKYGSLRESLREGWLTKDLFNEAMQIMSGDLDEAALKQKGYTKKQIEQLTAIADAAEEAATRVKTFKQLLETTAEAIGSGWAQSFRILIGDLEEAKKLYTRISDVVSGFIDNNARIRNRLFKQIVDEASYANDDKWKTGRDNFKQIIENMLAVIKTFLKAVKTGFLNVFPIERISQAARKVLEVVEKFTRAFVLNSGKVNKAGETLWNTEDIDEITDSIDNLIRLFRGLASAVDVAWMAISQPIKVIVDRIPFFNNFFKNTNDGVLGLVNKLGKFGDKITVFKDAIKNTEFFGTVLEAVIDHIDELGEEYPLIGAILSVFKGLKNTIANLKEIFEAMKIKPFSVLLGTVKLILTVIWNILNGVFNVLKSAKNSIDWSWLEGPKQILINFLKTLSDYGQGLISFEKVTGKIGKAIGTIFSNIASIFKKRGTGNLKQATGEITKSYSNLNTTISNTGKKISTIWNKIVEFFKPIGEFFKNIAANSDFTLEGIAKKLTLIGGAAGVATLGISHLLKTFAKIKILNNINDLLLAGLDVVKAYQREAQSRAILNIAIAIGILATSLAVLSFIPYNRLEDGLVIFSSFMAILAMTLPPIITAMARFNRSLQYTRKEITKFNVLNNLVSQLGKSGYKLAKAFNKKMLGEMFKDIAISIFILVGAIAALVLLFKLDGDTTIKAMKAIAQTVVVITAAVGGLVLMLNAFSKSAANTKASVATFSQFFKLAGVARIIMAIAASIVLLVGALAVMTHLDSDRLFSSWSLLMAMIGLFGLISIAIAGIVSRSRDMGKLKRITVSISGAMLGIAVVLLAMRPLIDVIQYGDNEDWIGAIAVFTAVITQFTAMTVALLFTAKKIGGQTTIWEKLSKVVGMMTLTIAAIGGVLYAIGKMGKIPVTTTVVLGFVTAAFLGVLSLLSLVAIVISRSKTTFSTNFIKVIEGISIGIGALIGSIGIMAAGIGILIAALGSLDIPDSDINRATNNLVAKLGMIADSINDSLPQLRLMFYNIGKSVGSMSVSFFSGFVDTIATTGETFNNVAEKFVNLIIDILGKVIGILQKRKEDVKRIIRDAIDLVGELITEVLNDVFKKNDDNKFKEEDILKWLGIGGAILGGGSVLLKLLANINTIVNAGKNLKTVFGGLKTVFGGLGKALGKTFTPFINQLSAGFRLLKAGKPVAGGIVKVFGKMAATGLAFVAALALIYAGITALSKGIKQLNGEARYVRSDITEWGDAIKAFFTDSEFRAQTFVDTFSFIGEAIMNVIMTIVHGIIAFISDSIYLMALPFKSLANTVLQTMAALDPKNANKYNEMKDTINGYIDAFKDTAKEMRDAIAYDWTHWGTFNVTNAVDGAYKNGKKVGEALVEGSEAGVQSKSEDLENAYVKVCADTIDAAKDEVESHSPSKVTERLWRDVMLGSIIGLKKGSKEFKKEADKINKQQKQLMVDGAIDASKAWDQILAKSGVTMTDKDRGVNSLRNTKVKIYDFGAGNINDPNQARAENLTKEVDLNQKLLELMIAQKDALNGKSITEARSWLETKAAEEGIAASWEDVSNVVYAAMSTIGGSTVVTAEGIDKLSKNTALTLMDVVDQEKVATQMVIDDQMQRYFSVWNLAEQNKDKLVGKKKEEVQEILKEEAMAHGLSEQEAEDSARLVTAAMFAGKKANEAITKDELASKISAYKKDYNSYQQNEKKKTELLQKQVRLRGEIEATGYYDVMEKLRTGQMTVSEYQAWASSSAAKNVNKLLTEYNNTVRLYNAELDEELKDVKGMYKNAGMSDTNVEKYFSNQIKQANKTLTKATSSASGGFVDTIKSAYGKLKDALGLGASDTDKSYWNDKGTTGNGGSGGKGGKDKAIAAAKDLKNGLEAQRADLTPTFDLDKLASDANKANGIVMSSLMAAQNASIGDYINKDSELNPFMKDRWQNVYNFTQNNYSPKALSRIDIYRQTQRQISMSRGF